MLPQLCKNNNCTIPGSGCLDTQCCERLPFLTRKAGPCESFSEPHKEVRSRSQSPARESAQIEGNQHVRYKVSTLRLALAGNETQPCLVRHGHTCWQGYCPGLATLLLHFAIPASQPVLVGERESSNWHRHLHSDPLLRPSAAVWMRIFF